MPIATGSLVDENWKGASIRELLERAAPFGVNDGTAFLLTGAEVRLPPQIAFSLGLGIHELATNAAKYGALSVESGRVEISRTAVPTDKGQFFHFE